MKLLIIVSLLCIVPTKLFAYRDGARENSCYDHAIDHGPGTDVFPCVPTSIPPCPFFLRIKEVVNIDTLELGNETDTYQCGELYGSKRVHVWSIDLPAHTIQILQIHTLILVGTLISFFLLLLHP